MIGLRVSDIDILHRIILVEGEAKTHAGTELGELYRQQIIDLSDELSPRCKMVKLLLPHASYEEIGNYVKIFSP